MPCPGKHTLQRWSPLLALLCEGYFRICDCRYLYVHNYSMSILDVSGTGHPTCRIFMCC